MSSASGGDLRDVVAWVVDPASEVLPPQDADLALNRVEPAWCLGVEWNSIRRKLRLALGMETSR